jgi:hypothetical protein
MFKTLLYFLKLEQYRIEEVLFLDVTYEKFVAPQM